MLLCVHETFNTAHLTNPMLPKQLPFSSLFHNKWFRKTLLQELFLMMPDQLFMLVFFNSKGTWLITAKPIQKTTTFMVRNKYLSFRQQHKYNMTFWITHLKKISNPTECNIHKSSMGISFLLAIHKMLVNCEG